MLHGRNGVTYIGLMNDVVVSASGERNHAFMKGKIGLPVRSHAFAYGQAAIATAPPSTNTARVPGHRSCVRRVETRSAPSNTGASHRIPITLHCRAPAASNASTGQPRELDMRPRAISSVTSKLASK